MESAMKPSLRYLIVRSSLFLLAAWVYAAPRPDLPKERLAPEYNWFEKWIKGKPGWLDWKEILKTLSADDAPERAGPGSEEKTDEILSGQN